MNKEYLESLDYVWYNYYTEEELSEDEINEIVKHLKIVETALQRLESIDNANPGEALKALKELRVIANTYCSFNGTQCEHNKELADIIEKALLKVQETKHYLKWENLAFTRDEKVMLVKMGDTIYKVLYRCCDGIEEVQLLSKDEKLLCLNLIGKYKDNVQLFNNLHLEKVEENSNV